MNVGYSAPGSACAKGDLLRSFRLGVSITALTLAGAAISPAMAQTRDLGTLTENRTSLAGFSTYTNGTLILTVPQAAPVTFGGQFIDGIVPLTFTKTGIGTLTLTGSDQNSHSGVTSANRGLLLAGAARVLSPNSLLTINGGRVDLGGFDQTVAGLSGSSAGVLTSVGPATLTINQGATDLTYSGTIGGAVAIVKNGTGVLTLLRGSTNTGGTILNAGVIAYGNNASFGSGVITIAGATELRAINQGRVIGNAIMLDAPLSVLSTGFSTTFAGPIDGGGSITKTGNGNLALLNPTNGFSGGVNLAGGGGITIGGSGSLGTGLVTISGQTRILVGGNFDATLLNDFAVNDLVQFTLPGVGRTLELRGNLSGPGGAFGGVAITGGDGTLLVTGDNSGFSGGFNVGGFLPPNGGILAIGSATATGTGPITSNNPATIVFNGNYTIDNAILPGAVLTIDTGNFDVGFTGDISNNVVQGTVRTGSLVKVGTGTLTLSGASSYTGTTTVVDGSLLLADGASIGGNVSVGPGSNFGGSGNVAAAASVTVTGGSISPGNDGIGTLTLGSLILDNASTLNFQLGTPGIIGGATNDLIVVSNTLSLDGTLNVSALPGFTTGSYRIINYGGDLAGPGLTAGPAPTDFNFTIQTSIAGQVNLLVGFTGLRHWDGGNTSPNGSYDGGAGVWDSASTNWSISNGNANIAWDNGSSGVFGTVGGVVTVVGTQSFGNLRFDVGGYSFTGGTLAVNNSTLDLNNAGTTVIGSNITGTGGLTKTGTGTLDLTGTSNYTGATSVSAGNLNIGTGGSLGNTAVTVASGATLSGTGSIAGPVTIASGGILSAGDFGTGVGTLTVGPLTLNNGAISNFQLGAANTIAGAFNDRVVVNGALTLGGTLNVTQSLNGNFTTGIYELFAYSGALTNNGFTLGSALPNGRSGFIQAGLVEGQVNLIVTQVPSIVLFWDGADGIGNGVISGGGGRWTPTSTNWTGASPSDLNTNWQNTIGVFQGTGGTVTIDGTQSFQALQFTSNGYTLVAGTGGLATPGPGGNTLFASTGVSARIDAPISGNGSIVKMGGGTIILGGNNSYGGGTDLQMGTLAVASNTALGPGALAMANGTTLQAAAPGLVLANAIGITGTGIVDSNGNALTLGGGITGGALTKTGLGTLTLSGVNTLMGPTTVNAGTLNVTGSLAASTTIVQTGAMLTGTGTVGPLTVQSGGTVSPGSPGGTIGTLSVNGAFTLASGATYRADTSPSGAADRIVASGVATLAGSLTVNPGTGTYATFNQSITLVTGSSVSGTFGSASLGNFGPAFTPILVYLPNSVLLRLAPASLVTQGGGSLFGNPLAVATAFDQAVAGGYDPQLFFPLYNQGANLSNALGQLSGELHSIERRVLLEETRVIREAAFDRLNAGLSAIAGSQVVTSEKGDAVVNSWYRGAGTWGRASADRIGARFTTEQVGFLTGIDYSKNGFTVGGMFHHLSNRIQTSGFGQSTVETTGFAAYAGYRHDGGGLVVNGGLSASGNRAVGSRSITTPGLAQSLNSRISGNTYQAFGEIAFDLAASPDLRFEPFARFSYTWVRSKAFAETGSFAATFGGRQTVELGTSTLGVRGGMNIGEAQISGSAGWLHYTADLDAPTLISITGINIPALIRSAALPRNAVALQGDAKFRVSSQVTMGIGYSGALSGKYTDHGVRGTLTVGF